MKQVNEDAPMNSTGAPVAGTSGEPIVKKPSRIIRRKNPIKENSFVAFKSYVKLNEGLGEFPSEKEAKDAANRASKTTRHIVAQKQSGQHYITPLWNKDHVQSQGHKIISTHILGKERSE